MLAEHTSDVSSSRLKQVVAGKDDEFLHGHLGKYLVLNLAYPSWRDRFSSMSDLSQLEDEVG
jgi:hypothetical protein